MYELAAKFGVPRDCSSPTSKPGGGRLQILGLFFLFVVIFASRATAAVGTDVQYAPITSVGPGPSFAIADFDGDQRPDLARVEGGQIGSSSTDYWIEFRLTATKGLQLIQLVAPPGGLVIKALDVNGDHAVDLVLTTAWFKQPVAVFLNDGHGRFYRAGPSDFPGAFTHADQNWNSPPQQAPGAPGVLLQSRFGSCSDATNLPDVRGPTGSVRRANSGFHLDSFLIACAGRAPPFEIPQV